MLKTLYSVAFVFLFMPCICAQDMNAVLRKAQEAEAEARKKANAGAVSSNVADRLLNANRVPTIRTGPTVLTVSKLTVGDAPEVFPPSPTLHPPGLVATFHGDLPPTGFCDFSLSPREEAQGAPAACNDKVTALDVPFGLSAKICEHDGVGPTGWGKCRDFPPGNHFVGHDLNDRGTTFWVTDKQMSFYFTSADDEVPPALTGGVFWEGTTDGNGKFRVDISYNADWYTKTYQYTLPAWCAHPDVWESTRNNNAVQSHSIESGVLKIVLQVKPRAPFGANSWVGVGVRCKP